MHAHHQSLTLTHTLLIAAALHGVLITTVGFDWLERSRTIPASLEVILLETSDNQTPEEADYLAQVNADGGDRAELAHRPGAPFSSDSPLQADGVAPQMMVASAPLEQRERAESLIVSLYSPTEMPSAARVQASSEPQPYISENIVNQTQQLAAAATEITERLERYAKRPRKRFVSARSKASVAAQYMHEWVRRVERVGNINFPDEVRRKQLSGVLILSVGIDRQGAVIDIDVMQSSGHRVLDDAARRIVEMASPFDPLTAELAETTDVLYITRSWSFLRDSRLVSG